MILEEPIQTDIPEKAVNDGSPEFDIVRYSGQTRFCVFMKYAILIGTSAKLPFVAKLSNFKAKNRKCNEVYL